MIKTEFLIRNSENIIDIFEYDYITELVTPRIGEKTFEEYKSEGYSIASEYIFGSSEGHIIVDNNFRVNEYRLRYYILKK